MFFPKIGGFQALGFHGDNRLWYFVATQPKNCLGIN